MPVVCRGRGFTLVELVVVMVVIGILAFTAMPRFFDEAFSQRGVHDGIRSALEYARRSAVASRRYVCATTTAGTGVAGSVGVSMDPAAPEAATAAVTCSVALPIPGANGKGGCAANAVCGERSVVIGGSSVIFNPLGQAVGTDKAVLAASPSLGVSGQTAIAVVPETGWIQ